MENRYIDTHCHINFFQNAGEIALKCENNQVHTVYVTTLPSQFEETYPYVKNLQYIYPSLGFHCLEKNYNEEYEKSIFLKNIEYTDFIGEIGLDFTQKEKKEQLRQINLLKFILKSIEHKDKILSIHSRNAEDKVLELLTKYNIKKVIFHWYSGKISTLKKIINHHYYFSISQAMIKNKKGKNIISKLPKDKVLIETDAPFIKDILPYTNHEIYNYLSRLWNISISEVYNVPTKPNHLIQHSY